MEEAYRARAVTERLIAHCLVSGSALGAVAAAAIGVADGGVAPIYLALCGVGFATVGLGVTLGLHRYFTHRSFRTARWLQITLAILGIAAGQGYFFRWVYEHRLHHRFEDQPSDPHSPYWWGERPLSGLHGFLHAHVLWMLRPRPVPRTELLADLVRDPVMRLLDSLSPIIAISGVLLPGLVAAVLRPSSQEAFGLGCLWGGVVRVFLLGHATWCVNSVCHMFGSRPTRYSGQARNNVFVGLAAIGEGWHANHHERPRRARHGTEWWQLDVSYLVLLALARVGAASNVRAS